MSRRYDHAMQKHGKGHRKKQKKGLPVKGFDLQTVSLLKDSKESEYEASWRKDLFSPEEIEEDKSEPASAHEDLPITVHAVGIGEQNPNQIGQEFSGITDRISKLLSEYESMYDDKDQQGYAAMQEHLSGQMAMESLLSDYKTLCRERDELLYSLQDSLDVDEEEILDELEALSKKEQSVDLEGAQRAIHDTFQNVRDTTDKLKTMNKRMLDLSKKGEATESLELEKRQLERELNMYKKMAVQQRKDIFNRRSSIRRDDTQQWKLVAGEMVDILNMVRHEGKLDKESLEKELNRIILTLNTQTEYIDNLKREMSKQERSMKNLEKDKTRLNNDKLLVEDQLKTKQAELKQCKQYLRKILAEKKDLGEKIEGADIDLAEAMDEMKLGGATGGGASEDVGKTSILQAQVRDARKVALKLEEENRELQRKLASLSVGQEAPAVEAITSSTEAEGLVVSEPSREKSGKECPVCQTYKARLAYSAEELKKRDDSIERLKEDLNKLRAQLSSSKKETARVKPGLASAEEVKEEGSASETASATEVSMETTAASPQASQYTERGEERIKDKPKKGSAPTVPGKKPKQKSVKSPKKQKKAKKVTDRGKQKESDDGDGEDDEDEELEEEEEVLEEEDKKDAKAAKKEAKKEETKRFGVKRRDLVVGECREEKAPYVKVREARMVTLADKGTQTSHYDRKLSEGISQRHSVMRHPQDRRKSLAEAIMSGVSPSVIEDETKSAMTFIKDEADRLCDEISGFVEYGFDLVQQGAKTTRLLIDTHLGEKASEMLESPEDGPVSIDKAKAAKALMSSDHRRLSIIASKKRRPSIQLERRGTIRRDSKVHLFGTPTDGMFGRKREDSFGAEADNTHPESTTFTEQKEEALASAGIERPGKQSFDGVTGQHDSAVTTGPPEVRRNTLFPDQNTPYVAQAQGRGDDNRSFKELQESKDVGGDHRSKEMLQGTEVGGDRRSKEMLQGTEVGGDRSSKQLQQGNEIRNDRSSKELQQGKEIRDDHSSKELKQGKEISYDRSSKELQESNEVGGDRKSKELKQGKEVGSDRKSKELQQGKEFGSDRSSKVLQQGKEVGSDRSSKDWQQSKKITDDHSSKEPQLVKDVDDYRGASVAYVTNRGITTQDKETALLSVHEDANDVFDAAFVKRSKWSTLNNFIHSLKPHKGGGCSHVLNEVKLIAEGSGVMPPEEQVKGQVTVLAQHVIDTLQSTAEVLNRQLEAELNLYEKFYNLWTEYRDRRRPSDLEKKDEVPVVGVKILSTLDERDTDVIKTEESVLFPPIIPQASSYQTGGRTAVATAGLSQGGMMMIQGAGPKVAETIPLSTSQGKIKKRGKVKNWSHKQLLLKQKEVLDKVLHVDARIEDLRSLFAEANEPQSHYTRQGIPPTTSQDVYFPLTTRSVALPSLPQGLQVQGAHGLQIQGATERRSVQQEKEKKQALWEVPREDEHNEPTQLPSMSNAVWQRRQSVAQFPSQRALRGSVTEQSTKLPLLNINHFLKVGQ